MNRASRFVILLVLAWFIMPQCAAADQDSLVGTYARIRPALAMVVTKAGKNYAFGSAFCIASNDSASYFLTNRHVIKDASRVDVFLVGRPGRIYSAHVVRTSVGSVNWSTIDAAILEVPVGNIPKLQLSSSNPSEGQAVAIAGFPATQIEFFIDRLGLSPSLHEGTVNALPANGFYIEYDAQADHGNSGGPLFDAKSGLVYGIVTLGIASPASSAIQTNLAISILRVSSFIANAKLPASEPHVFSVAVVPALATAAPNPLGLPGKPSAKLTPTADHQAPDNVDSVDIHGIDDWTSSFLAGRTFIHVRIRFRSNFATTVEPRNFSLSVRSQTGEIESISGLEAPAPSYYSSNPFSQAQENSLTQTVSPNEDLGLLTAHGPLTVLANRDVSFVVTFQLNATQTIIGNPLGEISWNQAEAAGP
jgi:S1-C subfamily serine protease